MKKHLWLTLGVTLVLLIALFAVTVRAEDDDGERDTEEREDDDDERWDFSDDFDDEWEQEYVPSVVSVDTTPEPSITAPTVVPVPNVDLSGYDDDDRDGIPNNADLHPGRDDLLAKDTDGDGISDREDLFPGKDDRAYQDLDRDGVMDDRDSDPSRPSDQDHDGIDDSVDDQDDRSFMAKVLTWLGLL